MRIVHTADWHMGLRLGSVDRRDDLTRAVTQVADICRAEAADILLVCGDLFDGSTRPDLVAYWTGLLATLFRDFLAGGGTIVALTGNHDNENLAQSLRHSFSLADPTAAKAGGVLRPGRFYLFAGPTFFRLADRQVLAHEVQFIVMPSPTVARYKLGDAPASGEDRDRVLKAAFRRTLDGMPAQPGYELGRPTVLAAHIPTAGAAIRDGTTFAQVAAAGVAFADGELPTAYAYVALGDLHRPQCLMGLDHVRYSGSIDRMDAGEWDDEKSVAVVDVGPAGLTGSVRLVPLVATTIHHVVVDDPPGQMPTLADRYPDRETALVKLTVRHRAGRDHLLDLLTDLERLFPRCYARDCQEVSADAATAVAGAKPGDVATAAATVEDTVRDYLTTRLADHPDRPAILALADELLAEAD
jgi:exonuclease SbcD